MAESDGEFVFVVKHLNMCIYIFAAVAILMSMSVYQIIVSNKLPTSSTSVPIIGQ